MRKWKARVYVAGPYTHGGVLQNVYNAIVAGDQLAEAGYLPFIPHLNHFWHMIKPHPEPFWLDWDNEWLRLCDYVLRLPGFSPNSDEEERFAAARYIPVVYSLEELEELYEANAP